VDHDGPLNSPQRNHFLVTMRYADQLLVEIEQILRPGVSGSLFPRYTTDFGPEDVEKITAGIAEFRKEMETAMRSFAVTSAPGETGALHAVATNLDYIDMEMGNLGPQGTRAYGELLPTTADKLTSTVRELQTALHEVLSYVRRRQAEETRQRLGPE
jgi:hypothetical protein